MRSRSSITRSALAFATIATVTAVPATAQQASTPASGLRAELIHDIGTLEEKYLGLAEAMTGKYDWRPGEGVRSVGEVFMHVAGANMYIPSMAGVEPAEAFRGLEGQEAFAKLGELEQQTDEATIKETLREAFAYAKDAVGSVPDDQLDGATSVFGMQTTNRVALLLLVTHMHEHLGQAIAYARINGVVPPWSAGS
jgi:uncharacterized damage-inducible protein DinB